MTHKKEAPSQRDVDAADPDALAAQFRPAWETTGEGDTITSSAPRPIERVTAQPPTDEDPTVRPVQVASQEESGERRIPGSHVHEDPTLRVPALEELTEVDRTIPTMPTMEAPSPKTGGAPPESGNFVVQGTARRFDAREMAHSDPQEMALSPMRPRAITVPTGFVAPAEVQEERTQKRQSRAAPPPAVVPEDRNRPTADVDLRTTRKPVRIVFGAIGGLVVLIGLGVIVKAALGTSSSAGNTAGTSDGVHAEPTHADTPSTPSTPPSPRAAKNDIPPPPPAEEGVAADPPPAAPAATTATTTPPQKPLVAARPPVSTPARPPVTRPASGGAAHPPQKPPKGGIVRDTPF